jgi:hypothetical protein
MPEFANFLDFKVPARDADKNLKLRWAKTAEEQGANYIRNQSGLKNASFNRDVLMGNSQERIPRTLSGVKANRPKRQAREIVATLSNLRARFDYGTDNKEFKEQASVLSTMADSWWSSAFVDRRMKEGLQRSVADGMSYGSLTWDPEFWSVGRGEIRMKVFAAEDVLPFHMGEDHDIQEAYAVTVRERLPLAIALERWPDQQELLKPDESTEPLRVGAMSAVGRFTSRTLKMLSGVKRKDLENAFTAWPVVTINYTYVRDQSVNTGERPLTMGEGNWEYKVPVKGSIVQRNGEDHVITSEEARIYPHRRLIIWTDQGVLYDDTSPYWHGRVPLFPIYLDKWPWEQIPISILNDVLSLSKSVNTHLRVIDDNAQTRLRPPLMWDDQKIARSDAERFDPRMPGQKIRGNMTMGGDPIKPVLDQKFYDVPSWITGHVEKLEGMMDHQMGVADMTALMKAKQVPSGDSTEALLMAIGPLVYDMARELEAMMKELGEQWKGLALQWYGKARRVQIVGRDGVKDEEFEFDPQKMVPLLMPWESEDEDGKKRSKATLAERARFYLNSFYMHVEPNSLHEINNMSRKLMALQLWRSGFPIDPWTVAEALDYKDFGSPPAGTNTIMERWQAWQDMKNEDASEAMEQQALLQARIQMILQSMGAAGGMGGAMPIPGDAGAGSGVPAAPLVPSGAGSGNPGQAGPGRPPSAQSPPKIEQKGDGRPVISESG